MAIRNPAMMLLLYCSEAKSTHGTFEMYTANVETVQSVLLFWAAIGKFMKEAGATAYPVGSG